MAEYILPGSPPPLYAAPGPGPAPVPDKDPLQSPEPPLYGPPQGGDAGGATSMAVTSPAIKGETAGYAYDVNAGSADAPYYAGPLSPVFAGGDADAGGRDDVAATVAGAVAAAEARFGEHQADTYAQGSVIGDLITFPAGPLDPGAGVGNTMPTGGFFDPPREYGGTKGAPGYQGEAQ